MTCTNCKFDKPLKRFQKNSRYKSGYHTWCKDCKLESQRAHPGTNKAWAEENKDRNNAIKRAYAKRHPDRVRSSKQKWQSANLKKVLAKTRQYQAAKLGATPSWLTKEQIKEMESIYINCPEGYEVDHEIPLQGKTVRGLHVPWNLRYLPISENRRKSNKI